MTSDHVFPQHEKVSFNADGSITSCSYNHPRGGLTLREYYAGLAMQGILADPSLTDIAAAIGAERFRASVVQGAVIMADLLLAELAKEKG